METSTSLVRPNTLFSNLRQSNTEVPMINGQNPMPYIEECFIWLVKMAYLPWLINKFLIAFSFNSGNTSIFRILFTSCLFILFLVAFLYFSIYSIFIILYVNHPEGRKKYFMKSSNSFWNILLLCDLNKDLFNVYSIF